tara:strand:- start:561 stop:806 length:246 start_codon:yes stop_codon:yes gene_type:complete
VSNILRKVKCPHCDGSGLRTLHINPITLFEMHEQMPDQKINFIKAVRTEWDIGLREAKEIVEAVIEFSNQLSDNSTQEWEN